MGIAAIVVTVFFINPAMQVFIATKANFGFCEHFTDFESSLQTRQKYAFYSCQYSVEILKQLKKFTVFREVVNCCN